MFLVYAIKELLMGIVNFFREFGRGLAITIKFRALAFDSKLAYKFPTHIRVLIWMAIAAVICVILYFILGYIGDLFLKISVFTDKTATIN